MRPPTSETIEPREAAGSAFAHARLPAPPGAARLRLTGELDLVTAACARAAIRSAQEESRLLICDLADLRFIDLTGVRVLLDAAAHADRTGGRLIVANSPPILPRMLRLLKRDHALEVPAAPLRTPPVHPCATFRPHVSWHAAPPSGSSSRPEPTPPPDSPARATRRSSSGRSVPAPRAIFTRRASCSADR